jgi:hypothetical protein
MRLLRRTDTETLIWQAVPFTSQEKKESIVEGSVADRA